MAKRGCGPGAAWWLAAFAAFLAAKWSTLTDPLYWDSFAYSEQIRFVLHHGLRWSDYSQLPFLRPPVYSASVAAAMRLFGESLATAHLVTWAWALAGLVAVSMLARELGATGRTRWLAVALLALAPTWFAQSGLILSDLPAATLTTFAWVALLRGSDAGFVVIGSLAVLCKEQSFALCLPAFAWVLAREKRRGAWVAIARAAPLLIPGALIVPWLLIARHLTGTLLFQGSKDAFGLRWLPTAVKHNFLSEGRALLWPFAIYACRPKRERCDEARSRRMATLIAAASLPFLFPGALTRYMLPSLPLLCALAAASLPELPPAFRASSFVALPLALLLLGLHPGPACPGGGDLDGDMGYRELLAVQRDAVGALAHAYPNRTVLATFPIYFALTRPDAGFVDRPLPASLATDALGAPELCRHDLLVDAAQGISLERARTVLGKARLTEWRSFGPNDKRITIYKIDCSPGGGYFPPPPPSSAAPPMVRSARRSSSLKVSWAPKK